MNAFTPSNSENVKKWYQKWWGIVLIIFLFLILVFLTAFAFTVNKIRVDIKNSQFQGYDFYQSVDADTLKTINGSESNYWFGTSIPKITIVEFADFACTNCQNSFPKAREAMNSYKNDIKFIYRDFPVISSYSTDMAMAARCAGEQGLFWVMHDKLFLNKDIQSKEDILKAAKGIGMNFEKFSSCLDSQKYLADIKKDIDDAQKLNIAGTPTWFINGNRVEGDMPYDFLFGLINKLINNK